MNRYRQQIQTAVEATVVHSSTSYSWFGTPSPELDPRVRRALGKQDARAYLTATLQHQLYRDFYCQGTARPTDRKAAEGLVEGAPYAEQLAEANQGGGQWTSGWEVIEAQEPGFLVRKGPLSLLATADEIAPNGTEPALGTKLSLHFPKDLLRMSPGFYMALGGPPLGSARSDEIIRWYWHLTPTGAVRFLSAVTSRLQQAGLAYRVKVLDDPTRFTRADPVVLYHGKSDVAAVSELLAEIYQQLDPSDLEPTVPAFTKQLASGVGLAEDPGEGESFGLNRCGVLAEQIIAAFQEGERVADIEAGFARQGISLECPYLNPGSQDIYRMPVHNRRQPRPDARPSVVDQPIDRDNYLDTAQSIGRRLCREAMWSKDRCNWMGYEPDTQHSTEESQKMAYRALGPDLYAGAAGVGLFLAQLSALTGDAAVRNTAVGAIRQALARVDEVPQSARVGLYTGWSGIAYAAARAGALLDCEELLDEARQLALTAAQLDTETAEPDLLCGAAGTILTLTALGDVLGQELLSTLTRQLGDTLLDRAIETDGGTCWPSVVLPHQPCLTGFSHGAAGIGLAMLELFETTGDCKYRDAGARAFGYEEHLYDSRRQNWPDLRSRSRDGRPAAGPPTFSATWCHGAPGIALARLRALRTPGFEHCRPEALAALETTRLTAESWLANGGNYSLCHGLAGNADILLTGARALGRDGRSFMDTAHRVARHGIDSYGQGKRPWLCGTRGESPGLMLGLAGIGSFYLRMFEPTLPSVLALERPKTRKAWRVQSRRETPDRNPRPVDTHLRNRRPGEVGSQQRRQLERGQHSAPKGRLRQFGRGPGLTR